MLLDVGGFTIFVLLVGQLGRLEGEATSMVFSIGQLAFMPVWGCGMATTVLVGRRLGENNADLAARSVRYTSSALAPGYMAFISALFILAPWVLLSGFFSHNAATAADAEGVKELAVKLLRFVAAYNMFDATAIIFVCALRALATRDSSCASAS